MDVETFLSAVVACAFGGLLAYLVTVGALRAQERSRADRASSGRVAPHDLKFVFDGEQAIDTPDGHSGIATWTDFRQQFGPRFEGLEDARIDTPADLAARGSRKGSRLLIRPEPRWTRVTIESRENPASLEHSLFAVRRSLDSCTGALDTAPYPIWTTDADGMPIWNNMAYRTLAGGVRPDPDRPDAPLFDLTLRPGATDARQRLAVTSDEDGSALWYEVHSRWRDQEWLHFAIDINAVVNSELAQRNFVQTLTKTFANLSIGLAIFDRNRQLALFNPALIDLTALPADFLSLRPDLFSFFDRLRDRRMMPEPKNYENWRDRLTALATEARHGNYSETWTLPSGLTYRVSGRPHPDGAVAFLFEDISADISLTRRFRTEIETGQNVLDNLGEAVAVFSPLGALILTNTRYDALWPETNPNVLAEVNIVTCTRAWQSACAPTPLWTDLRGFIGDRQDRVGWSTEITRTDGRRLACHVRPLVAGSTLVAFASETPLPAPDEDEAHLSLLV